MSLHFKPRKSEFRILLGPQTRLALLKGCFQFKTQVIWDLYAISCLYLKKKSMYLDTDLI